MSTKIFGKKITREMARELSKPVLDKYPYIKRVATKVVEDMERTREERQAIKAQKKKSDGLNLVAEDKKFIKCKATIPWLTIEDTCKFLGIDRNVHDKIRKKLQALAVVYNAGKVGSKNVIIDLTDKGKVVARNLGFEVASTGKGGVIHRSGVHYTEKSIKNFYKDDISIVYENVSQVLKGRQPDFFGIHISNDRIAVQYCHKNQAAYEAKAIYDLGQLLLLPDDDPFKLQYVLMVANTKGHKEKIKREVQELFNDIVPDNITYSDFDTVYDPNYRWDYIFEFRS